MPLDVQSTVYAAVKAKLLAYSPFTTAFQPGARVWADVTDAPRARETQNTPGFFPQFWLDVTGVRWPKGPEVFINAAGSDMPDHGVPVEVTLTATVIHDSLDLSLQTGVEQAVWTPVLLASPRLGIAWVGRVVTGDWRRRNEKTVRTGNVLRAVSEGKIVVYGMPQASALST